MGKARAAAVFVAGSLLVSAAAVIALLHLFPDFFSGPRGQGIAWGTVVGWTVMVLTFLLALFTVDKSHNIFLGGYVAGFLARLAAFGITAAVALTSYPSAAAFWLLALVGAYVFLSLAEGLVLSQVRKFGAGNPLTAGMERKP
jgi:hypothetical protein